MVFANPTSILDTVGTLNTATPPSKGGNAGADYSLTFTVNSWEAFLFWLPKSLIAADRGVIICQSAAAQRLPMLPS